MYRSDVKYIAVGASLWIDPEPARADTQTALAALRESLGDAIEPVLAGPWVFVDRVTVNGRPHVAGAYCRLRAPDGYELDVHHGDVRLVDPHGVRSPPAPRLRVVSSAPEQSSGPPAVEPPRCDDRRPSWRDNRKVGAVYVEAEPGGTARVSLVAVQPEGGSRCEANVSGLAPHEVEAVAGMLAARLAGRVVAPAKEA